MINGKLTTVLSNRQAICQNITSVVLSAILLNYYLFKNVSSFGWVLCKCQKGVDKMWLKELFDYPDTVPWKQCFTAGRNLKGDISSGLMAPLAIFM